MYEGPRVEYADLLLQQNEYLQFNPIALGNPFLLWYLGLACLQSSAMEKADVKCTLLENYGEELLTLTATLLVNILIGLAGTYLIYKLASKQTVQQRPAEIDQTSDLAVVDSSKQTAQHKWKSRLTMIVTCYGLPYFLAKMVSIESELLLYCFLAFRNSSRHWASAIGVFVSFLIITFYLYVMASTGMMWYWIWEQRTKSRVSDQEYAKIEMSYEKSPSPNFAFLFAGMKKLRKPWDYSYPFLQQLRAFILAYILTFTTSNSTG